VGRLVDKAAKRDDSYELVRLAHAYPGEGAAIDLAVAQVAGRLGAKRKGEELAYLLTLPEAGHPWHSLQEVNRQLLALGPKAAAPVRNATMHSHDAAKLNGAHLLEQLGRSDYAEQLRQRVTQMQGRPGWATVPTAESAVPTTWGSLTERPLEGLGGWLVLAIIILFMTVLSAVAGLLSLGRTDGTSGVVAWTRLLTDFRGHAWAKPLFVFELLHTVLLLAYGLTLITLVLQKRRLFRALAPWYYPFGATGSLAYYAFAPSHRIGTMTVTVLVAIGWALYFVESKRVSNTFVVVRSGDARIVTAEPVAGPPAPPVPSVPWGVRDVWLGILAAAIVIGISYALPYMLDATSLRPNAELFVTIFEYVFYLLFTAIVWWFAVHRHGATAQALGFVRFRSSVFGRGAALLFLYFVFGAVYSYLLSLAGLEVRTDLTPVLDKLSSPWPLVISVVVVAPLAEELFCRSFVFGCLRTRYDWRIAAAISAAVFAAFHLELTFFIPAFVAGYILAYLYQRSNSVWPCIIAHMCVNGLAMAAAYSALGSS
jgi:uncharacterized protein